MTLLRRIQSKSAKAWQPSDAGPVHRRRAGRRIVVGLPFALWRGLPRAHRPQRLPGQPCSQQELEFGELCTGDATCGDAGRCYVAAAETEAKVLAATTRRRCARRDEASLRRRRALSDDGDPTDAPTYWTPPTRSHFQPRDRRFLFAVFIGFVALALGLGAAVAAHAFRWSGGARGCPTSSTRSSTCAAARRASTGSCRVAEPGQGAARARRRRPTQCVERRTFASRRRPRR